MTSHDHLLPLPNVVGAGTGWKTVGGEITDDKATVVLVRDKLPALMLAPGEEIPAFDFFNKLPTDVRAVGELRALRKTRQRPAPPGVSIGHVDVTAGTFGAVVRNSSGMRLILSNNHVLANSNAGAVGDDILQPGTADGGRYPDDRIATLYAFEPINFGGGAGDSALANLLAALGNRILSILGNACRLKTDCPGGPSINLVDAALAIPLEDEDILDEILDIGVVRGTSPVVLGMPVRKSGRTTGLTTGQVDLTDATVRVSYGTGREAIFERQIITSAMSAGGDSGSLLVTMEGGLIKGGDAQAVGLLFAGSDQVTIHNPVDEVLAALSVSI